MPNLRGWFVIQFDQPFSEWRLTAGKKKYHDIDSLHAGRVGAFVRFASDVSLKMRIATSFISLEQARENLEREIPNWVFEIVKQQNQKE